MKQAAEEYFSLGLSVIPVGKDKRPRKRDSDIHEYPWKKHQSELIKPNGAFAQAYGIGIVCGKVSGGLECIDFDLKNDITGKVWEQYKQLVHSINPELLKKLVVEQSPSAGFHLPYRCEKIDGNKKLASRHTTAEEREKNPHLKSVAIIETRGEGGYFASYPTPGYELIYQDFSKIPTLTVEERDTLIDCAKTFNSYYQQPYVKSEQKKIITGNASPFEDWNKNGDVLAFLESHGWTIARTTGSKVLLLRPGGTGKWSADFDTEKRLLYVFTTSTEFENEKAYNPAHVLTTIQFGGDFSAAARWLIDQGYGEKPKYNHKKRDTQKRVIDDDDENFEFVATDEDTDPYIRQLRDGTFIGGKTTGHPTLDQYWLFKSANLVIVNGHDNVGKSVMMWYLATMSAILHKWKWIIYSSENKVGGIKKKIIEFSKCKDIKKFSEDELQERYVWFDEHFTIVKNADLYTYTDMLAIGKKLNARRQYNGFLIDPYNSLWRETNDTHEYDYRAMTEFRQFVTQTGCGIYLNCHSITEALRRMYPNGHEYAGHPQPPGKADTEGGGKFSNKADDFMTFHRMTQHEQLWHTMEIHVRKIKEQESGGHQTPYDSPVKLSMVPGGYGYVDIHGFNPILDKTSVQMRLDMEPNQHPDKFIDPKSINEYQLEDQLPF